MVGTWTTFLDSLVFRQFFVPIESGLVLNGVRLFDWDMFSGTYLHRFTHRWNAQLCAECTGVDHPSVAIQPLYSCCLAKVQVQGSHALSLSPPLTLSLSIAPTPMTAGSTGLPSIGETAAGGAAQVSHLPGPIFRRQPVCPPPFKFAQSADSSSTLLAAPCWFSPTRASA